MKKTLVILAALPLIVGCASDRYERTAAERHPAAVSPEGYQRTDRDFNARDSYDNAEGRRQVRDSEEQLRDAERRDQLPEIPPPTTSVQTTPSTDVRDFYPEEFTPRGLENWQRHRWFREF